MRPALLLLLCSSIPFISIRASDREWNAYQPGDGLCYIRFPANPEYQTQAVDAMATHIYIARDTARKPAFVYSLAFGVYPKDRFSEKDAVKKLLDSDRDAFVRAVNGKVISEKAVLIAKSPGRAIVISGEDGQARYLLREFIVDTRLFQLIVCVPKQSADDPDVVKFFESFQLAKK